MLRSEEFEMSVKREDKLEVGKKKNIKMKKKASVSK